MILATVILKKPPNRLLIAQNSLIRCFISLQKEKEKEVVFPPLFIFIASLTKRGSK
ncbi:hypothetical protein [Xenorhabdus entomophaga]|uniref:hypothetical protein n=1 Tax=Xenorhabdus entomophaga TaxID=3136257 RepID=UPI0030F48E31